MTSHDAVTATDPTDGLRFDDAGLICTVVQQFDTKEVLMVAWMLGLVSDPGCLVSSPVS